MLGDASSNVHMQYLREGVLMTEAEENKMHQSSFNKVNRQTNFQLEHHRKYFLVQEENEYPMLAGKDTWTESRDNLHDHVPAPIPPPPQNLPADNEVITKPRHAG